MKTLLNESIIKKALGGIIDDLYGYAKGKVKLYISDWRNDRILNTLYEKTFQVRMVKTIWQSEKPVDLLEFYYPSKIKYEHGKIVNDLHDIPHGKHILIQGSVGSGKSIFFRYLTIREMCKGRTIPLFIELRQVRGKLKEHLVTELNSLGLNCDLDTFDHIAQCGRIVLLLDGYDEVETGLRSQILGDIKQMSRDFDQLRMFISSRPGTGLNYSSIFYNYDLCPLGPDDYKQVIRKMENDEQKASKIIKGVEASKSKIAPLLTTPLMVALLLVRYRIEESLPENVIDFYEGIFDLLIRRHDKTKPAYKRDRKAHIGDTALYEVFTAISYLASKTGNAEFTLRCLQEYTKNALKMVGKQDKPDDVIDDIITITNLILEEGGYCSYIHRSILEYHTACFIKSSSDENAKKFYDAMVSSWSRWEQELWFLAKIDDIRYLKYLFIPDMRKLLQDIDAMNAINKEVLFDRIGNPIVLCQERHYRGRQRWCFQGVIWPYDLALSKANFAKRLEKRLKDSIDWPKAMLMLEKQAILLDSHRMRQARVSIDKLLSIPELETKIISIIRDIRGEMKESLFRASKKVDIAESTTSLAFDFISKAT